MHLNEQQQQLYVKGHVAAVISGKKIPSNFQQTYIKQKTFGTQLFLIIVMIIIIIV